jgi:quercetin dioxygenase-like cupin family protein
MHGFAVRPVHDAAFRIAKMAHFDLTHEIADSVRQKPWPSGIHARTLFKKSDFRVILISMENGARMKEHHIDGTTSVHVLKGHVRYSTLGREYDLQAGGLITLGASIRHEVESRDESVFLLTISWPDNQKLADMQHRGYGS